ncbi:MAG: tetratricopeptide repeat protein [Winogradskyella sp.]|nr:tetratricopeptide repeat protein [Winogradskyella sp.]
MKSSFLLIFLLFFSTTIRSQNAVIDSLKNELSKHTKKDTTQVYLFNTLAFKNYGVDHNELKKYADSANAIAKAIKYTRGEARSLYMTSIFHLSKNELDAASTNVLEALSLYEKIKDTIGMSTCYDIIGTINNYQGNYDKSIEYYSKAIKIAESKGDKLKASNYLSNIASIYSVKGDYDKALEYYKESVVKYDSLKSAKKSTIQRNNMSIIYMRQGKYLEALENFQLCVQQFRNDGNKIGEAGALLNIGIVYSKLDEPEKSLVYQLEALNINRELGNDREVSKGLINLGNYYVVIKEYKKALTYFNESLTICEKINDTQGKFYAYQNIGSLYTKTKEFDLALTNFKKCLDISKTLGEKRIMAVSYINLGSTYYDLNNHDKAFENAIKGKKIADELETLEHQKEVNLLLSHLYEDKTNYKEALNSFKAYKAQSDSLFNEETIKKLTRLEYEYKYKEALDSASLKELKLTKTLQSTSQDLQKSQRNYLWATIGVLLLSIVLGAFIFYQKLKNAKSITQNAIIEQKLLRSQMTPHFIFNSLSVLQGMILNKEEKKSIHYLSKFSKLLRITLENSRDKTVSLSQELTAVQDYLTLQTLENEAYKCSILVEDTIHVPLFEVPPMLIQPFVENAIEHAFVNRTEDRKIDIRLTYLDKKLICTIEDNVIGINFKIKNNKKDKISLATPITSERLKVLSKDFKMEGSVTIEDRHKFNEEGTLVTLVIPHKINTEI